MEIQYLKISELKPFPNNPRKISEKDMNDLVNDLREFGFVEPIVVNKDLTIIGGHQRIEAAKRLGMTEVPCYVVDLSAEQMKILNIALNKIQGEWDYQKLQNVLIDLPVDMQSLAGFSGKELEKIMFLFSEDNINIMADDKIGEFEKEIKNHEIRILIPLDYEGLEEVKGRVMAIKQDYPDIVIKEVM
jgi:ParB-like chromosome segregation protein Spo0J